LKNENSQDIDEFTEDYEEEKKEENFMEVIEAEFEEKPRKRFHFPQKTNPFTQVC
jgi:hypothetical protein